MIKYAYKGGLFMGVFFQLSITHVGFYLITFLWIMEFVIFPSKFKSDDYSEQKTFKEILTTIILTILITVIFTYFNLSRLPASTHQVFYYTGLFFYALGLILRYTSTLYLGKFFTRNVEVSKDQTLVSKGPYKHLRHPLYLGLFLLTVSVPLFFAQPLLFLMAIWAMGVIINKRMRIEEESMKKVLGQPYKDWLKSRYRFIPYIY